jgi:hypothetical protein
MEKDLLEIIKSLYIDPRLLDVIALRERLLSMCEHGKWEELQKITSTDAKVFGNRQEHRAICTLVKAYISYHLKDSQFDILQAEAISALRQFRIGGSSYDDYNEGLVHWYLGLIYHEKGDNTHALRSFTNATEKLEDFIDSCEARSDYQKISESKGFINRIQDNIPPRKGKTPEKKPPSSNISSARIVYAVKDLGHASREGKFVWDDDYICDMTIDEVQFENIPHKIFNLRGGSQISLVAGRDYRWLRIAGESMNCAKPIPFENGDYILADLHTKPQFGDIVVAKFRNPPTPAERAGAIKRYHERGLVSESTQAIAPIPFLEVDIRGVVIAIAKPA